MSIRHTPEKKQEMAKRIKSYRLEHDMSQEELARFINTSVFSISRWETAKHYPTASAIRLMKILKVL